MSSSFERTPPQVNRWQQVAVTGGDIMALQSHCEAMTTPSHAEVFVTGFADFWLAPSPARLPDLLHSDVRLRQPLVPSATGIAEAQRQFVRFCRGLPNLRARVDHWSSTSDLVFIEFTVQADLRGENLEWPTVNRLLLRDDKAIERVTYFDRLVVMPTLLRHPGGVVALVQILSVDLEGAALAESPN